MWNTYPINYDCLRGMTPNDLDGMSKEQAQTLENLRWWPRDYRLGRSPEPDLPPEIVALVDSYMQRGWTNSVHLPSREYTYPMNYDCLRGMTPNDLDDMSDEQAATLEGLRWWRRDFRCGYAPEFPSEMLALVDAYMQHLLANSRTDWRKSCRKLEHGQPAS